MEVHRNEETCVPLFAREGPYVCTIPYGRNHRPVLQRSHDMESWMRRLGRTPIDEYHRGALEHDGILYTMFTREQGSLLPRYIGKAEVLGKGNGNLSVNISDLEKGHGNFGRWGYNYAYHLGDLSAVTCPGHPPEKATRKYEAWRDALFIREGARIRARHEILFWATLWGRTCQSVWKEYGSTRLAFEEYLLIGITSDLFPDKLLNHEGRNR